MDEIGPQARHLRLSLSGRSASRSLRPDKANDHAACSVVGVERVRDVRFCSIKGSSTSPQLMHRNTFPSDEYSGRDSTIINPLHF